MKRYCQTLEVGEHNGQLEKYIEAHRHVWPVIQEGIRSVGILDMQIYAYGRTMFMICDTTDDFDWVKDNDRLSRLPQQAEWEAYVAQFQGCALDAKSTEKWHLMEKIFELEKPKQ